MATQKATEEKSKNTTPPPNGGAVAEPETKAIAKRSKELDLKTAQVVDGGDTSWQLRETGEERVYWKKAPGAGIQGVALRTDKVVDEARGDRTFIVVQLTQPTIAVGAKDGETKGDDQKMSPGDIVWVGISYGLKDLYREVATSKFLVEVAIKSVKLVDIGKGQSVWRYAYAVRPTKNMRIQRVQDLATVESAFEDGDVPF